MGMFDRMYDADGNEWQTKAFGRALDEWHIGDTIPTEVADFQVECMAEIDGKFVDSLATVLDCELVELPAERQPALALISYGGGILERAQIGIVTVRHGDES